MDPKHEFLQQVTRRRFLHNAGKFCLGTIAFASMSQAAVPAVPP